MKYAMCAAVLLAGLALGNPALADRWVTPVNGTVSAVMMPDGAVMMKVKMPPAEFRAMGRMMAAGQGCKVQEVYPGASDTMILVCGG